LPGRKRGVEKAVECAEKCIASGEELQYCFVKCYLGYELVKAYTWLEKLEGIVSEIVKLYGFKHVTYSREFKSFVEDPFKHLGKKLFIYTHDYVRGRIGLQEYAVKAMQAVNTSLRTNMRTLYQNWCFLAILKNLHQQGAHVVFPEHGVLDLERSGKQKLRWIPPNLVLSIPGSGLLSFYIEAPRPISWGDSSDLRETWKLYTALRPDLMVYGGEVYDIVDLNSSPPVKRPDVILEFKELPDWYKRVRDVKGPLAKPLSAEEWRSRWIEGLWDGLAEVLGVTRREAAEKLSSKRGVRLSEVKVAELYRSVYSPREMILVSKHRVPGEILRELEAHDIVVVDSAGFNAEKLASVAEELLKYAKHSGEYLVKVSDSELYELIVALKESWEKGLVDREVVRKTLLSLIREAGSIGV